MERTDYEQQEVSVWNKNIEPPLLIQMFYDMLPSYRTMKYKSPIWGYFHVQKE